MCLARKHNILLSIVFIFSSLFIFAQTEEEMNVQAAKFFKEEQYLQATPLYARLLALHAKDFDYNFHYGACLLYNSSKKQDAIKYLVYAVTDPQIAPEAWFFLGKAYHLNYQFNEAIKNYSVYLEKVPKEGKFFDAEHEIQMCQNGKRLMTTLSDLIVLDKKEIEDSKFFRIYDLKDIGGTILVTAEFQTKLDKKNNHIPVIHFPQNPTMIFYSSYGENGKTGKDIYVRRKLPDGSWGMPQPVPGNVNTAYDEDFPYMHPDGEYLYFSSKGHNSMGGYDVFRSKYDPETNSFGPPENLDFAISSPDDDLMYVVDSTNDNAFFASARQSEAGKLFVYKVKVTRVPLQLAVVKGNFSSEVNPSLKKINFEIRDYANGDLIGKFNSNDKAVYLITFPKGGKYEYIMNIDGVEQEFRTVVSIPFMKEFKPLKQKIVHTTENGIEQVKIINLFNEEVDDPAAVLAEVIKMRAELNVNVEEFDLNALESGKQAQELIQEAGYGNLSLVEIREVLNQLIGKTEENGQTINQVLNNIKLVLVENGQEFTEASTEMKQLVAESNAASTPDEKFEKLLEAEALINKQKQLAAYSNVLSRLKDSVQQVKSAAVQLNQLEQLREIEKSFNELLDAGKENEAVQLLIDQKKILQGSAADKSTNLVPNIVDQLIEIDRQMDKIREQDAAYQKDVQKLQIEIQTLENSYYNAKKKDLESIDAQINAKKEEVELIKHERVEFDKQLNSLALKKSLLNKQVEIVQDAVSVHSPVSVNEDQVRNAVDELRNTNNNSLVNYVENQLNELERKDPTLRDRIKINSGRSTGDLYTEYKTSEQGIEDDPSLSKTEKLYKQLNNDRQVKAQVKQRQLTVEKALKENPENAELLAEQTQNAQILAEIDTQIAVHEKQVNELVASTSTGETSIVHQLQKDYDSRQKEILENQQLSEKQKTAALKTEDEKLLAAVNRELLETTDKLKTEPENSQLGAKKETLTQLKQKTELAIQKAEQELLTSGEKYTPKQQSDEELLQEILPGYSEQIKAVSADENRSQKEKTIQLLSKNEQLVPEIDAAIKSIDQQLKEQEQNEFLEVKKSRLLELKAQVETTISQEKAELKSLKSTEFAMEIAEKFSQEEVVLNQQLEQIKQQTAFSESEKISKQQEVLENYQRNLKNLQKEITESKEIDPELKQVLTVKSSVDQKIVEVDKQLEALQLKQQKLAEKPVPTVAELKNTELEAIQEKLPEEFRTITANETEKALNQAISRDELLLKNIQTAQKQFKNQENGQQSGMQQAYDELIDSLQTDQQQLKSKLEALEEQKAVAQEEEKQAENTFNQEKIIAQVNEPENKSSNASSEPEIQEKIVLKTNDELVPDYALLKQQLQEEVSEPVKRLNDLISLENKLLNSLQLEVESLQNSTVSTESEKLEVLQLLENRITEQKQRISEINQQVQDESAKKQALVQTENILNNNTAEQSVKSSDEQEINSTGKTVEALKSELFSSGFSLDDPLPENISELTKLDAQLDKYEVAIQTLIREEQQISTDNADSKKAVYEQELETIQQKRRQIKLAIGDLELVGQLPEKAETKLVPENSNQQLTSLKTEEKELEARLDVSESKKEQKEIQRDLTENRKKQVQVANEELVSKIGQEDSVLNVKQKQLSDLEKQQNNTHKPLAEQTSFLTDESLYQEGKAEKSKSVSEKNYWLKEAEKSRSEAVRLTSEALVQMQIELVEKQTGLILEPKAELEQHKRRILLEIGSIEQLEDELEEELAQAPKKAQQNVLNQQKFYTERKKELLRQLEQTEEKIIWLTKEQPVSSVPQEAIREPVSIQEEYELSMETAYKNYAEKMQQVVDLEKQLKLIDSQLEMQKKNLLNDMKSETKTVDLSNREMQLQIEQLNKLEKERKALEIRFQLAQKQAEAELPADEQMKLKMQNMVMRGIAPVDKLLVAASLVAMPASGITYAAKAENSVLKPIPVDVIEPSGLVYRVQVGAFAKPIPEMLFSEFTPVSGEKLGNGITRYLAGYFNNDHAVQLARNEIRNLGYSDAFAVAYCDGKRITLAEAREMEAKGTCVPKGVNELVLEVQLNTAEKLGLEDSVKKKKVSNHLTYNQAPGAVKADAIEQYEGLFYTVQVGVYNQPVTTGILMNFEELKTLRLSNGQIRYSSGMFASADEARPRKAEAIQAGVADAFIAAYYKGERISVEKADKILAKYGSSVLVMNQQKQMEQIPVLTEIVKKEEVQLKDTLAFENVNYNYQLVSKAVYTEFPRDVLNRYNARGVFYYDETDGHVKSEPVAEKELLPNIRGMSQDIDTVEYLVEKVAELNVVCLTFAGNRLPGDVADWLIRYNFQREIQKLENELIVKLFVPDQQKEQLKQMATERNWQFKLIQNDKKEGK